MSRYITKIRTEAGDLQIDYNALANLPISDISLTEFGRFADSKTVGDKFKSIEEEIEKMKSSLANVLNSVNVMSANIDADN